MSNTFQFADRLGFSPPIKQNHFNNRVGFYKKHIHFKDLVTAIKEAKPKLLKEFDYTTFESTHEKTSIRLSMKTDAIYIDKYLVDVPFTITDETGNNRDLQLYGTLNKKIANVRTDIYIARITVKPKSRKVSYHVLFVYEGFDGRKNSSDRSDINRVAIVLSTHTYQDYKALYKYLGYKDNQIEEDIYKKFTTAFSEAQSSSFDLAFVYNQAPNFVLQKRETQLLWKDLFILLKGFVLESKEKAILKVLKALAIDEANIDEKNEKQKELFKTQANVFFHRLMLTSNQVSVFEQLYDKLNNYGFGDNNFTELINALYGYWKLSDFADPTYYRNKKEYEGGPETLPYQNTKVLGFYNNNFEFNFVKENSRLKIKAIKEEVSFLKPSQYSRRPRQKTIEKEFATYNLFHPIQLAEIPKSGELKVPDKIVPAFFLKAMDDMNKWSNLEDGILLTVDVVTTATGVGNLYKLRHLRHLTKIKKVSTLFKIKTAISFIEVTSGTLNIILNLADSKSPFAQKLREYLFWLEMASLGTDVVVGKLLKKSAKEALDIAIESTKTIKSTEKLEELSEVIEHLSVVAGVKKSQIDLLENWDNLPVSGIGRRNGQRISRAQMKKIKETLKELDVDLELHSFKGSQTIQGFYIKGVPAKMPEGAAALFITDGVKMKIILRKGATIYEFFHEFMHFRHSKSLGLKKYLSLGGRNTPGEIVKEEAVFNKIVENKSFFTKKELKHALDYLNERVYDKNGIDPIDFDFNINKIPNVRQEVKINEIITKK